MLPKYSIAIRTLGTAGEKFRVELESIQRQTVQPEHVLVYVADTSGVKFIDRTIGKEEFRYIPKGMVAQRALSYDEIDTPYILLLDDDVELAPDSAERLLKSLCEKEADAVGADIFKNQEMRWTMKVFALLTNWVTPHYDERWAYKVTYTGAFSYLSLRKIRKLKELKCERVNECFCLPTQKLDGPCVMWRKEAIRSLQWEDERWMDRLSEFAYGDDLVESYKLYVRGGKLWLNYDSGVIYLNAKTASSTYHHTNQKFYIRSLMSLIIWYRCLYSPTTDSATRHFISLLYILKGLWLLLINGIAGFLLLDLKIPVYYVKGIVDALKFIHSDDYKSIPSYLNH